MTPEHARRHNAGLRKLNEAFGVVEAPRSEGEVAALRGRLLDKINPRGEQQ